MSLRGGRRLTTNLRAPVGTPEGYVAQVDADEFVVFAQSPGGFAPTFIASGETFTVPANKQVLFAITIDNEGDLVTDGDLVMVD